MRLPIYYLIHFSGIFMTFMCIGAMCIYCKNGGLKQDNPSRKFLAITHGVGLLFLIVGGMGLMKFYGFASNGMPGWIVFKMCIWLVLGMSSLAIYKKPQLSTLWFYVFLFLGIIAGITAKFKSFEAFIAPFK